MMILLLLILSFHLTNIAALTCDKYNITHFQQNDNITINFPSNNSLKLNRTVRCTSNSLLQLIDEDIHHCIGLGYGQAGEISVQMQDDNGTTETCLINYITQLQPPSVAYFNITDNKIHLGVNRPIGSFDYFTIKCSINESYTINYTSMPLNNSIVKVTCSFLLNVPLMSFLLETVKKDFGSVITVINHEIPLPINFTHSLESRLLTVRADTPPTINLNSIYEFQVIFYNKTNATTSYERIKISDIKPYSDLTFNYGLIPNFDHKIIFKHIVDSMGGYSQSEVAIPSTSNVSYPFEVEHFSVNEKFHSIILNWTDTHFSYDPIEFIVFCNSSESSMRNVGRSTTYVCEQTSFNETDAISVQTRVAIPGYTHDRIAVAKIEIQQIPEIPVLQFFNNTENSITIRWNFNNNSSITNLFKYKINCDVNQNSVEIDIRSNQYQCQSLVQGTLYIITMSVENINNTIQRSTSIQANTLLEKCKIVNHFYSSNLNGSHSVIIEWNPPNTNFDKIFVQCPSSLIAIEYSQIMPNMFVKCPVTSGVQFNVTFSTFKSGYDWQTLQFTDIPLIDSNTTISPSTSTTTTLPGSTTTVTTTAFTESSSTTTATATTTISLPGSPSTTITTTSTERPSTIFNSDCSQDALSTTQDTLTKWRLAAIIAFIIVGILILATICLIVLCVRLSSRNRYKTTRE